MMRQDEKQTGQQRLGPVDSQDMKKRPHCSIGAFTAREKSGSINKNKVWGTAFLISPNLLLTAAHNCFSKKLGLQNSQFLFYPGANGQYSQQTDPIKGIQAMFSKKYRNEAKFQRPQEDYALVKLQKRVNQNEPYQKCLPLTPHCQICQLDFGKQQILEIYGYPAENSINYKVTNAKKNIFFLQQEEKTSNKGQNRLNNIINQKFISYYMTTFKGQSGSPVNYGGKTIAFHIQHGNQNEDFNIGRLLTVDVLKKLQEWSKQMGADPFQIDLQNLCPHLRKIFKTNYAFSLGTEIDYNAQSETAQTIQMLTTLPESIVSLPPQIPEEYRFDAQSLNSPPPQAPSFFMKLFGPPKPPLFLRWISNYRRKIQVERSQILTVEQKCKKMAELNSDAETIDSQWWKQSKFQDNKTLICRNMELNEMQKQQNLPELTLIDLAGNNICQIDLSSNKNLNFVNLRSNMLQTIQLKPLSNLIVLLLYNNKISQIDLSSNQQLAVIHLHQNGLKYLKLPMKGSISVLFVNDNKLSKFRFFWDPAIFSADFFNDNPSGCQITIAYEKKNVKQYKQFLQKLKDKYKYYNYAIKWEMI